MKHREIYPIRDGGVLGFFVNVLAPLKNFFFLICRKE